MNKFIKVTVLGHEWIVNVENIVAVERFGGVGSIPEEIYIYLSNGVKLDVSMVSYEKILALTAPQVLGNIDKSRPL